MSNEMDWVISPSYYVLIYNQSLQNQSFFIFVNFIQPSEVFEVFEALSSYYQQVYYQIINQKFRNNAVSMIGRNTSTLSSQEKQKVKLSLKQQQLKNREIGELKENVQTLSLALRKFKDEFSQNLENIQKIVNKERSQKSLQELNALIAFNRAQSQYSNTNQQLTQAIILEHQWQINQVQERVASVNNNLQELIIANDTQHSKRSDNIDKSITLVMQLVNQQSLKTNNLVNQVIKLVNQQSLKTKNWVSQQIQKTNNLVSQQIQKTNNLVNQQSSKTNSKIQTAIQQFKLLHQKNETKQKKSNQKIQNLEKEKIQILSECRSMFTSLESKITQAVTKGIKQGIKQSQRQLQAKVNSSIKQSQGYILKKYKSLENEVQDKIKRAESGIQAIKLSNNNCQNKIKDQDKTIKSIRKQLTLCITETNQKAFASVQSIKEDMGSRIQTLQQENIKTKSTNSNLQSQIEKLSLNLTTTQIMTKLQANKQEVSQAEE